MLKIHVNNTKNTDKYNHYKHSHASDVFLKWADLAIMGGASNT